MFFLLMVFPHHINDNSKRNDEGSINVWSNIDGITITEDRELLTNSCQQVAVIVTDGEIPAPDIAVDVECHAVSTLDLETFTKQAKLLMHAGPKLAIAVNLITWQEREHTLLDMYQLLTCITVKQNQVITYVEEFATYLKNGIARVVTHDKSLSQAPGTFFNVIAHNKGPPSSMFLLLEIVRRIVSQVTNV